MQNAKFVESDNARLMPKIGVILWKIQLILAFPEFCRQHPHLILEHLAHIFGVGITYHVRNLVQLKRRVEQQVFDLLNPVFTHGFRKGSPGLFFKLGTGYSSDTQSFCAVSSRVIP